MNWFESRIIRRMTKELSGDFDGFGGSEEETIMGRSTSSAATARSNLTNRTTMSEDFSRQQPCTPIMRRKDLQVDTLLGVGAFSKVYRVRCTKGRRYAMKHLKKRLLRTPRQLQSAAVDLISEATVLAQLDHPHIVTLLATAARCAWNKCGTYDSFFLLLEELSETLDDRIHKHWQEHFPQAYMLPRKLHYGRQISEAIIYLHEHEVIYRDLKPANIGFSPNDPHFLKLFDFGICRELPKNSDSSALHFRLLPDEQEEDLYNMTICGTERYMAVEVMQTGKTHTYYNLKADVYSWAMVFYEMLTHQKPYDEFTPKEHREAVVMEGERPALYSFFLPDPVEKLLRDSWEQRVPRRLTMFEVQHQLRELCDGYTDEQIAASWPSDDKIPTSDTNDRRHSM